MCENEREGVDKRIHGGESVNEAANEGTALRTRIYGESKRVDMGGDLVGSRDLDSCDDMLALHAGVNVDRSGGRRRLVEKCRKFAGGMARRLQNTAAGKIISHQTCF